MEIADLRQFMVLYCFLDSNWSYRNSRTLFIGAVVEFVCHSIHQLFHCLHCLPLNTPTVPLPPLSAIQYTNCSIASIACHSIHQLLHCLQAVECDDSVDGRHDFHNASTTHSDRPLDWLHILNQGHTASGR